MTLHTNDTFLLPYLERFKTLQEGSGRVILAHCTHSETGADVPVICVISKVDKEGTLTIVPIGQVLNDEDALVLLPPQLTKK